MRELLLVGLGSFLGGVCRFGVSGVLLHLAPTSGFPLGTFMVNILGCFAIGLLGGLAEHHHLFSATVRLFLITGILGGFTTFSAFGFETVVLFRTEAVGIAALYVGSSVVGGLCAVWLGLRIAGV